MRSYMLGLMASSIVGFASAEDLLPCGNAFYVASQYTCYAGATLCPVENGQPTEPCGRDCYLPTMYSCNNGKLAPPVPSEDGTFLVMSLQSPHLDSEFIQASGLAFRIGGGPPATYCPARVGSACPAGEETVWTCSSGYCGLTVEVPGSQQIYVGPNGAVGYTMAHSAYAPPGSQFFGFSLSRGNSQSINQLSYGQLLFGNSGFHACPSADNSSVPQLYVGDLQTQDDEQDDDGCYPIKLVTSAGNQPGFAAWQYT